MILRNSAECLACGDTLISEYRHDFRQCQCGNVFVDGGTTYLRHGRVDPVFYLDTSIVDGIEEA